MLLEFRSEARRLLSPSLEDRLVGLLSRAGGALLLAGVAAAWASLLTWSLADPRLTHTVEGAPSNALGTLGAVFSDVMLNTLGFAAVFVLLAPMFWGIELLLAERIFANRKKASLFPFSVLLLAGGFSALPVTTSWPFGHGFGGLVGDWLCKVAATLFAFFGAEEAYGLSAIIFFLCGFVTLGYSVGLERKDLSRLIAKGRDISCRRGSFLTGWLRRLWFQDEAYAGDREPNADSLDDASRFGSDREPYLPGPMLPESAFGDGPAGTSSQFDEADLIDHVEDQDGAEAAVPWTPDAVGEVDDSDTDLEPDYLTTEDRSSRAIAERFAPASADRRANTDQSSRAIAERFAPASADRRAKPSRELSEKERPGPRKPQRSKGGLLAGLRTVRASGYRTPPVNLLKRPQASQSRPGVKQNVLRGTARLLEEVLADFSIKGEVRDIKPGPVVTLFEVEPARGTKSSRVVGLADDIARSMSMISARAAVVPGRNVIGIELPNVRRETVYLREIFESDAFRAAEAALPLALGKSIGGDPVVADLARMPHLLVAGTTGSGKSVGINSMVLSLLYRCSPEDCRLLMIDPKMLELSVYNGIPHLLTPVVTDPQKAVAALNWVVGEMEERYKRMASLSVRNIEAFNSRVRKAQSRGEMITRTVQTGFDNETGQAIYQKQEMQADRMPYMVVVVDEFADLMIVAGKEIEAAVQRLAQMARAAGIHLIMATQRPSVDIVTGTIKANFPTRIGFKVASKIDSRTILNEQGAEQLLGQGDMLYSTGSGQTMRAHGPFVTDEEVESIAEALRRQGPPRYIDGVTDAAPPSDAASPQARESRQDDLYDKAVATVLRDRKVSTSYLQRRLSIGYNRAADVIERMEREGLIGPANNVGKREILITGRDGGSQRSDP
jgi:S-DNA-T family DNA segregation ATPase FtsK/SpoIIIE